MGAAYTRRGDVGQDQPPGPLRQLLGMAVELSAVTAPARQRLDTTNRQDKAPQTLGRLRLTLIAAFLGALVAATPARADLGLQVRASPEARRPLPRIAIAVPRWSRDAVRTVYVLGRPGDTLEDVSFRATVGDEEATLTPSGAITIPGGRGVVPLRISVPNARATDTGTLVATAGQRGQTLAQIAIKRDPEVVVSVAGADDGGVKRISRAEITRQRFTLVSGTDRDITDLRVRVGPLRDPEGRQVLAGVRLDGTPIGQGGPYVLRGRETMSLTVTPRLEVAGEHQTTIRLTYGRTTAEMPVQIRRTGVAPTVQLTDPGSVQLETSSDKVFDLEIRESGGHQVVLPPPSLVLRKVDEDRKLSLKPGDVALDGAQTPTIIQPGQAKTAEVTVPGVDGPGRYEARISFGGEPEPKETTATLFVRRPAWVVLILLLAVMAISELLRRIWSSRTIGRRHDAAIASLDGELTRVAAVGAPVIDEQIGGLMRVVPPGMDGDDTELGRATRTLESQLLIERESLGQVAAAESGRSAAWRTWLDAAADHMALLPDRTSKLPGVDAAAQERLRQQLRPDTTAIREASDPRIALERYFDGCTRFLEVAAAGLAETAGGVDGNGRRRPEVARLAGMAVEAARAGHLRRAWADYGRAIATWNGTSEPIVEGLPTRDQGNRTESGTSAFQEGLNVPARITLGPPLIEVVVSGLAALGAVTAALLLLYAPDRTFGSATDLALAAVLAVAIHQILTVVGLRAARPTTLG